MESAIYMAGGADVLSPPLMIPSGMLRGGRVSFQYEQPDGKIVKVSYKVKTPRNETDKRSRTKSISSNFKNRFTNWRKSISGISGMRRRSLSMDDITAYENRPLPPIPSKKASLKDDHPYDRPKYRPGNVSAGKRHSSYHPTQQLGNFSFAPSNSEIQEETNEDNSDDTYMEMNTNFPSKANERVTTQDQQSAELLNQFDTYEIPTQYKQKVVRRPKPSPVRTRLARQNTIEDTHVSRVPRDAPKVDINPRFLKRSYSCDALTMLSQWELFQEFCNNSQDVSSPTDEDSSDSDSDMEYDRKKYLRQKSGRMSFTEALFRDEESEKDFEERKQDLLASFDAFDLGKPRKRSNTLPEKLYLHRNNYDKETSKDAPLGNISQPTMKSTKGSEGKTIGKEEVWV